MFAAQIMIENVGWTTVSEWTTRQAASYAATDAATEYFRQHGVNCWFRVERVG